MADGPAYPPPQPRRATSAPPPSITVGAEGRGRRRWGLLVLGGVGLILLGALTRGKAKGPSVVPLPG